MTFQRCLITLFASILISSTLLAQSTTVVSALGLARPGALKVVMLIDCEGNVDFEVLDDEIINLVKKDLNNRCRTAKKEWSAAKKVWKKKYPDVPFCKPKPITPKVTVLKKGFHTKGEAQSDLVEFRSSGPYCIYQVIRGDEESVRIDQCGKFNGIKYALETEYHQAVVDWLASKASFEEENAGETFDKPQPPKVKIKILKNKIKTMDKANGLVAKYEK